MIRGTEIILLLMVGAIALLAGAALSVPSPETRFATQLTIDYIPPPARPVRPMVTWHTEEHPF